MIERVPEPFDGQEFLSERQHGILRFAVTHGEVTRRDLEELLPRVPPALLQQDLREMGQMGVLEAFGSGTTRCYIPAGRTASELRAQLRYARPTSAEAQERRAALHELDRLLDDLEGLNLIDARQMPSALREQLEAKGVPYECGMSFGETIEAVFGLQERFMGRRDEEQLEGQR